jgi:hypothetical protein
MKSMIIVWLWISCCVCAFVSLPSMNHETAVLVPIAILMSAFVSKTKGKLLHDIKRLDDNFKQNT